MTRSMGIFISSLAGRLTICEISSQITKYHPRRRKTDQPRANDFISVAKCSAPNYLSWFCLGSGPFIGEKGFSPK